jgi:uncharacterized protein YutE (UPF0331/DUF86 family)
MLDICTHIISMSQISPPKSYADCMVKLGEMNIFETEQSRKFSNLIKMRNIIVHQYDSIDHSILYESLETLISDFKEFQDKILKWLD